jgi:replicative superfamily II helicase
MTMRSFMQHNKGKIIMLAPLKQLVKEKVDELQEIFSTSTILNLTGDTAEDVGYGLKRNISMQEADIIICSYEMFDSLTRRPSIYTALNDLGLIIIDEIHSLGDSSRGAKLDGAITRFMLRMQRFNKTPQCVCLSATFQNVGDLQRFFQQFIPDFHVITSEFSPIKANVDPEVRWYYKDSIDVFMNLIEQYKDKAGGILAMKLSIPAAKKLCQTLNDTYGENFARTHFSDMSREARDESVDLFNEGKCKVLCTTPTLLAGVNVAATVIFLDVTYFDPLTMEMNVLSPTSIRQASGRVGRVPRFNEGWIAYLAQAGMEKKVKQALNAPHYVGGAMNSALELVLNVEIALQAQNVETLREWYSCSYSGISVK